MFKNIGKVRNEGLEITLNTTNVSNSSFTWESNFNISFNKNKVLGLAENQENLLSIVSWENSFSNVPLYIAALHQPAAQFLVTSQMVFTRLTILMHLPAAPTR